MTIASALVVDQAPHVPAARAAVNGRCVSGIRRHWHVENAVSWVLDVVFREDAQRARSGYAATNCSLLRKMALNRLRQHTGGADKTSPKGSRMMAARNPACLADVISPFLNSP